MEKNTAEYLCWLADTRDQPLEEMAAFFDAFFDSADINLRVLRAHEEKTDMVSLIFCRLHQFGFAFMRTDGFKRNGNMSL